MTNKRFKLVLKKIKEVISNSSVKEDLNHAKSVHKNVLILKPEANEALQIAALAHDIDRAVEPRTKREDYENYDEYKHNHALRSARIIAQILKKSGYDKDFIKRVGNLIEKHEIGVKGDVEILKDADSMAYFQYGLPFYIETHTIEQTEDKIKFMYNRLSSDAKERIRKIFLSEEVSEKVKKLFLKTIPK